MRVGTILFKFLFKDHNLLIISMMQNFTLRTINSERITKSLETFTMSDCLDLVRQLGKMEEDELKKEETKWIIASLEARIKKLIFE